MDGVIRRNAQGRDMDRQVVAQQRHREKVRAERGWLAELADNLGVEPQQLVSHSAAAVAELMRTSYPPTAAGR